MTGYEGMTCSPGHGSVLRQWVKHKRQTSCDQKTGGEGGIRPLGTGISQYNDLAKSILSQATP
jgi:hypothetical protein